MLTGTGVVAAGQSLPALHAAHVLLVCRMCVLLLTKDLDSASHVLVHLAA